MEARCTQFPLEAAPEQRAEAKLIEKVGARIGLYLAVILAALGGAAAQTSDRTTAAGNLIIDTPWTRATPGGSKVAAGYMTIINRGETADRLLSGASGIADRIEIHTMTMEGGVMRMRELEEGLALAPKSVTELKPGGYHIMFIGLEKPITKGDEIPLSLTFATAGKVDLFLPAAGIGAKQAPGAPSGAGAAAGSRSGAAGSHSGVPAAGSHAGQTK